MRRISFLPALIGAIGTFAPDAFAQRQTAVGPGVTPLNATGILGGVDMSASGTTGALAVGVVGGPRTDIYTLNTALTPGLVAIGTAASSQGNVVFNSSSTVNGAIGQTQPGGPFLLGIAAGNDGTTTNFRGNVFATTLNVVGTGTVNFDSGATNITATNFAGDGIIGLGLNSTLIGALTTTAGAQTGTLSMAGGSVLDGAVGGAVGLRSINVVGGSNLAGVTATISGAANAYAFSLGTNTLNVGGALTIANGGPGGVINTTLAGPTVFGNIRPVGSTNLGSTLLINVTVPSTALIPVGTQFNIVQTRAGTVQSGTDGSVVQVAVRNPTNPLYTFSAVPLAGTNAGLVTIRTTGIPLLVPITPPVVPPVVVPGEPADVTPVAPIVVPVTPLLPVAQAIVPVLVPFVTTVTPSADLTTVLAAVNDLSDAGAVVNAVASFSPAGTDLVAPLVTYERTRQFQALWLPRLDTFLCGFANQPGADQPGERRDERDSAACTDNNQRSGAWMNGFGYAGSQNTEGSVTGYKDQIIGTMIGYDMALGPNTRAGVSIGRARSTIDGNAFDSRTVFDSYVATAYVGHERGAWFVNGALSVGWNDYTSSRQMSFPGVYRAAQGSYGGQDYTAYGTTGYNFVANGVRLTPLASLQYTRVDIDAYNETGAGDLNLNVQSRSYDFLESGLGGRAAYPFVRSGITFVPELHARWLHQFSNPTMTQTASFGAVGSSSFVVPGQRTSDNTFNVGAGLTLLSCNCTTRAWSLEAVYDYFRRDDGYEANQGMLRFASRF
ncbi:autotransporter domain-containing protein [Humitalea sp. 24SJ18S-53]|uniref:autotransporter family protein n=1 Tax=Humitalea sp. 24SJ18S-53 TaxID=3422307 RepID=UPI003D67349C